MARHARPWFRPSRGVWYVTLGGKQYNLGPGTKEEAEERLVDLKRKLRKAQTPSAAPDAAVVVVDEFLEWAKRNRGASTYQWYLERLQPFARRIAALSIAELQGFHLQSYLDSLYCSPGHKRGIVIACQRPFRWAYKLGRIDRFPLGGVEKPPAGKRETVISEAEFRRILSFVRDRKFTELLTVSWECGCRPQESLRVEARHVDLDRRRWIFPATEAKGKKRIRIVYLTKAALEITRRLMFKHPSGPLFRNSRGKPYCGYSVNCCFGRIQSRMGLEELRRQGTEISERDVRALIPKLKTHRKSGGTVVAKSPDELFQEAKRKLTQRLAAKHAPRYCLYNFRHTWMNRLLEAGVDPITIATLAGHVDTSMLARTYQHVAQNPEHLLKALQG